MSKNWTAADFSGMNLQSAEEKELNLEFYAPLKYYSSLKTN